MPRFRRFRFKNNNFKNKIKQTNTRINNLQNQIKNIKRNKKKRKEVIVENKKGMTIYRPNNFNLTRTNFRTLRNIYETALNSYLTTLIHPELAVNGTFVAKQPSFTPIPTSNVTFKEQFSFTVPSSGIFNLYWNPNFLATIPSLQNHGASAPGKFYFYSHLALVLSNIKMKFHSSYMPQIDLSKYRLVSAKLEVSYSSFKMIKSGILKSVAVYDDLPVFIGKIGNQTEDILVETTNGSELCVRYIEPLWNLFDEEKLNNGLWNKTVNLTGKEHRLDNLAVPTDPTDHTFFPLCHYYSVEPTQVLTNGSGNAKWLAAAKSSDGGHLSYLVQGTNLKGFEENSPITMTCFVYYNFEVIATSDTAPFLRSKDKIEKPLLKMLDDNKDKVNNAISEIVIKPQIFPSNTRNITKNLAGSIIREVSKPLFNMIPASSFIKPF